MKTRNINFSRAVHKQFIQNARIIFGFSDGDGAKLIKSNNEINTEK